MIKDVLGEIFKFCDFSNIISVSLVCQEWFEVLQSESLWKFYFNNLYFNAGGDDQLSLLLLKDEKQSNNNNNHWKNLVKERCKTFNCFLPKRRFIGSQKLNLSLSNLYFPTKVSETNSLRCLAKMMCYRMRIESVHLLTLSGSENLNVPFHSDKVSTSQTLNLKIVMKMDGLKELIIIRAYNVHKRTSTTSLGRNYFLYFALESDDLEVNQKYLELPIVKINQLVSLKKSFIFQFMKKDRVGLINGQDYLIENVLSKIVSPIYLRNQVQKGEMTTLWCLLVGRILSLLDASNLTDHKEVWKFFPTINKSKDKEGESTNSMLYLFRRGQYRDRAKRIASQLFENEKFLKFINPTRERTQSSLEELKKAIVSLDHRTILGKNSTFINNGNSLITVRISKEVLKQLRLMLISDEFMKYYMDYKFGRIKE